MKKYKLQFIGGRKGRTKLGGVLLWKLWEVKDVSETFYDAFKNNPDFREIVEDNKIETEEKSSVFKKNK